MQRHTAAFPLAASLVGATLVCVILVWAQPTRAADPEPLAWDQEKVTALAQELARSVHGLAKSARQRPADSIASGQSASRMQAVDDLRRMELECKKLVKELEAGAGREKTLPVFRRLDSLRKDIGEQARRMFLPQATLDKLQDARTVLEQMRAFYTGAVDARPDLHGPTQD